MMPRPTAGAPARVALALLALSSAAACASTESSSDECQIVQSATALPHGLNETSGVVVSRDHPGVIWTHNDSGNDPELAALQSSGELLARVRIDGAEARDWEDLALGPCPSGSCLYLGDIGDGEGNRTQIDLYRFPEPDPARDRAVTAERFPMRYAGGPRDAEAIFVLPSGEVYLVTKGRTGSVEVFRYPLPLRSGETVTLEPVVTLADAPQPLDFQVTGASASASGEWVAIRTYKHLALRRTAEFLAGNTTPVLMVNLTAVGEPQGEAVHLLDNGTVLLTSEGGFPGSLGSMAILRCPLEE